MCNAVYKARVHVGPKDPYENEELKNVSLKLYFGAQAQLDL